MRALLLSIALCLAACKKAPGWEERSPDGGTMLEIDADCGGQPLAIDGEPVLKGIPKPVKAGRHRVECGDAGREVEVHDGRLFHFKFWGMGQ